MTYTKTTVLIVDDSAEDRQTYQRYLLRDRTAAYNVSTAHYAREGLQLCVERWPDLIIMDFLLPDLDGIQFIDALEQVANGRKLPALLVLTGQGNEEIAVTLMKKGVADYLTKNKLIERSFQASIHRILSQIQLQRSLDIQQQWQRVLYDIALRVRRSIALTDVLNTAVVEIKDFLKCDRVIIYQFNPDLSGEVVAEAVDPQWRASLGEQIIDTCFQSQQTQKYQAGYQTVSGDIYQAGLSECHIGLLEAFQVKAVLVVPILINPDNLDELPRLWGLLICHQCRAPRQWTEAATRFLEQLSVQLAIAIYQAELVERLNQELVQRHRIERDLRDRTQEQEGLIQKLSQITALLEQRNQDLDSFVAIASHDLRAPLRAIKNLATWLSEDLGDVLTSGTEQQFKLLTLRVEQMEALLNDLLEYARIGRMNNREIAVDVKDLLAEILQGLVVPPDFKIAIAPDLPSLSTDRTALEQVFTNLIGNAIKHHPRGDGKVKITATRQGGIYCLGAALLERRF